MSVLASIRIALRALRSNTLRSALTMLGIVIGVGAVIAMVAVGSGAAQRIKDQIASVGSNLLLVVPGSATSGGLRLGQGSTRTLTEDDAWAIVAEIPGVTHAGGARHAKAQIVFGNQNWTTWVAGVTTDFPEIRDWEVAQGTFFGQEDFDGYTKVAVLGLTVKEALFGDGDAIGQIIRIGKVPFTVVGVMAAKGQDGWGQDQDDAVIIPLSTAKKRILGVNPTNPRFVPYIRVKVAAPDLIGGVAQQVRELLRQRHRLPPYQDNDFQVRSYNEIFAAQEATSTTLTFLLAAIASISLLVGGIGIMNIMLASVTERTREIGLRMAVGARRRDILGQFLIEAVTLALIGGVLGVSLGVGASKLIAVLADWTTLITPGSIAMAFGSAACIGVFFGYYPAHKAASLDPIDALRYE